jgi:hypothetical protein
LTRVDVRGNDRSLGSTRVTESRVLSSDSRRPPGGRRRRERRAGPGPDFEFSGTAKILEGDGELWSAIKSLPKSERYTYDYQGNQQVLDQILISPAIRRGGGFEYDSVHINSEFHDQISDHDPQVLRFRP